MKREGSKEALDKILSRCCEGEINPYNYTDYIDGITYAKNKIKIENAFTYYESKSKSQNHQRDCTTVWMYGPAGTGKSTFARKLAENYQLSICVSATGKDPFSKYSGEQCMILDDLRPDVFSLSEFLKISDPHFTCAVHSRYKDKTAHYQLLIVTSSLSPEQFYSQMETGVHEDPTQLFRRIAEVWQFTSGEISISVYDPTAKCHILKSTQNNSLSTIIPKASSSNLVIDGVSALKEILDLPHSEAGAYE